MIGALIGAAIVGIALGAVLGLAIPERDIPKWALWHGCCAKGGGDDLGLHC
jgi:hypothetical protein